MNFTFEPVDPAVHAPLLHSWVTQEYARFWDMLDATVSDVRVLDEEERVVELARMLAGHEDSAAAREHARELVRGAVLRDASAR